jgi:RNA polymerase sigma-70 factor (ECF subfamily)
MPVPPDTEQLLQRVERGDRSARGELLDRHSPRLRRLIGLRLDPRLAARIDPSDVLQETLAVADRRLPDYLRDRPMPFYPWLRRLACDQLAALRRQHIGAGKRSVLREEPPALPDASVQELADRLFARTGSPSSRAMRTERRALVRAALNRLAERDREVLVLRHLEQLDSPEIAIVLEISEAAVHTRHLRALRRLRQHLGPDFAEDRP